MIESAIDGALAEMRRRSKNSLYLNDPVAWASDVVGKHMWSKQAEIAGSIVDNTHTAVVSCNGAGKSATAGILGAWWVATHDAYEVALIASAPTYPQISRVLFRELKDNHKAARLRGYPLPGHINQSEEWKLNDEFGTLLGFGRRPSDTDIVSAFQGIHRRFVFVILDEAGGIPPDLYTAAEAVTTSADSRVLAIGNPDRRGTEFHRIFREDETWNKIKISAYDSPNFTGEWVPEDVKPLLIQPSWVDRQKIAWGEDSARFKSKVLGEFPDEDDTAFFSQQAIDKGLDTEIEADTEAGTVLGVDLARFGEDDSVIYINNNGRLRHYASWSKATSVESANRVHQAAIETGASQVRVDGAGLGGPVIDQLAVLADGKYTVISMMGSAASPDRSRYYNARAYNFDSMREQMLNGKIDIDMDDKGLFDEMMMLRYKFSQLGSIQIESKDDMRSRGVKSPDNLDSAVYACVNLDHVVASPYGDMKPGDKVYSDPEIMIQDPFYTGWTW